MVHCTDEVVNSSYPRGRLRMCFVTPGSLPFVLIGFVFRVVTSVSCRNLTESLEFQGRRNSSSLLPFLKGFNRTPK